MKDMMKYKGYFGSINYAQEDVIFYGKVEYISALISYEAQNAEGIYKAFQAAVDDYLALCQDKGVEPETPFKGSYNVRIGQELHRKVAAAAKELDMSINNFTKEALEKEANNQHFFKPDHRELKP